MDYKRIKIEAPVSTKKYRGLPSNNKPHQWLSLLLYIATTINSNDSRLHIKNTQSIIYYLLNKP